MRIGKGCERCRRRHIRCIVPDGASCCNNCAVLDSPCRLHPPYHFRPVRHVYQKPNDSASKYELTWDRDQVWVRTPRSLKFVHDTPASQGPVWTEPDAASGPQDGDRNDTTANGPAVGSLEKTRPEPPRERAQTGIDVLQLLQGNSPGIPFNERGVRSTGAIGPDSPFPSTGSSTTEMGPNSPWISVNSQDSASPTLSTREAVLFRAFIRRIAPWVDICDLRAHFTTDVPRRALQVPMVLKAVLAVASSHDALLSGGDDWEASAYHGQCLELLIAALAQPEENYDENLLLTVVFLRIYEELEQATDQKCHLFGSNRLLNTMSKSASSGGLAEAVSWQFLRQAIYASVVQDQPLQLNMKNYERSSVFHRTDDAAYANVIIFLSARLIQECFGPASTVSEAEIHQLSQSVEQWYATKPVNWQPLQYQPADVNDNRPFPEIWVISPPAVVGLQYYHASRMFLTAHSSRRNAANDYDLAWSCRRAERTIASHLKQVIGLSLSNLTVENAYFMACHLLHRYGYCLHYESEQRGSLQFLDRMEQALGWRTSWIAKGLEQQWRELHDLHI